MAAAFEKYPKSAAHTSSLSCISSNYFFFNHSCWYFLTHITRSMQDTRITPEYKPLSSLYVTVFTYDCMCLQLRLGSEGYLFAP